MLLFIQTCICVRHANIAISKQLMLLFIHLNLLVFCLLNQFQNILCYCLSLLPCPLKVSVPDFKTSYVIVYPYLDAMPESVSPFQNILCYCLSMLMVCMEGSEQIFQNILCYCLLQKRELIAA